MAQHIHIYTDMLALQTHRDLGVKALGINITTVWSLFFFNVELPEGNVENLKLSTKA